MPNPVYTYISNISNVWTNVNNILTEPELRNCFKYCYFTLIYIYIYIYIKIFCWSNKRKLVILTGKFSKTISHLGFIIIIIIIIVLLVWEFFTPAKSDRRQVSSSVQDSSQYFCWSGSRIFDGYHSSDNGLVFAPIFGNLNVKVP